MTQDLHDALTLLLSTMNAVIEGLPQLQDCGKECPGECGMVPCDKIPPP